MTSALHHFEAHRAGGAFDRLRRRLDVVGVQILHLQFGDLAQLRSEEHTSELQSLMRISYAVFCLKKKTQPTERHRDKSPLHIMCESSPTPRYNHKVTTAVE